MGKPYTRKRGSLAMGNVHTFTCLHCGHQCKSKKDFKQHWRESADHDQRKIK